MMSRFFYPCIILLIVGVCVSQVVKFGPCPVVETKEYFELEKFLGTWYEIERFPTWYEDFSSCGSKTIQACGRKIEIVHTFVKNGIEFVVHMNSTYAPGAEAVFEIQKNNVDSVGIPLSVIETDYKNYAVVYGCRYNDTSNFKYFIFAALAVWAMGSWSSHTHAIFKDIGVRLVHATGDLRAGNFFAQRISIAIQRGNAASVLESMPVCVLTWILSRERTLHDDYLETARSVLGHIPYANVAYLEQVDQSDHKCSNYIFTAHVHTVNINNED